MLKMTREELARDINCKANIGRIIKPSYQLELEEGDLYDNLGKVESWTEENDDGEAFKPEADYGEYTYLLQCEDVPCHRVDYNNKKETETLGATDCNKEYEVLVREDAIMRVIGEPQEVDFEEMGYYVIELEFEGFKGE